MAYYKKIGVFLEPPGGTPDEAGTSAGGIPAPLSAAFARDLLERLDRLKKCAGTVFHRGGYPDGLDQCLPRNYTLASLEGSTAAERLYNAFTALLTEERDCAIIIGTCSPDLPLQYIKRAFLKLKHKDVVLGPAPRGGLYLAGLKYPPPPLFGHLPGGGETVFQDALDVIGRDNLSLALMPLWHVIASDAEVGLLKTLLHARRLEKSGRLMNTEHELQRLYP